MCTREHVLNKLKQLGFSFKRQAPRVDILKRSSDHMRVEVPRRSTHSDEWVRSTFRQIGLSPAEISEFLRSCQS